MNYKGARRYSSRIILFVALIITSLTLLAGIFASELSNPASALDDPSPSGSAFSHTKLSASLSSVISITAPPSCTLSEDNTDPSTPEGSIIHPTPDGTTATCRYAIKDSSGSTTSIKDGEDVVVSTNNLTGYQLYIIYDRYIYY